MNPFVCVLKEFLQHCTFVAALALSKQPLAPHMFHQLYEMEDVMRGQMLQDERELRILCSMRFGRGAVLLRDLKKAEAHPRWAMLDRTSCADVLPIL